MGQARVGVGGSELGSSVGRVRRMMRSLFIRGSGPRRLRTAGIVLTIVAALAADSRTTRAQVPPSSIQISGVVDTSLADVRDIVRVVRAYLNHLREDSSDVSGLWSTTDSLDRRFGDLARFFAYYGYPATVVGVLSTGPADDAYVVKVLHANVDTTSREVEPWALQRLYAIRASESPYKWKLSAPLIRSMKHWTARQVGRINFHYAPGQAVDSVRAIAAANFVDSVAALFAVRPPEHLDYLVAASPDEYFHAIGLDFLMLPSGPSAYGGGTGGHAVPEVGLVLAGDPKQGEAYRHELVHAVLGRGFGGVFLSEGIATWLGGSRGRTESETLRHLRAYQESHPGVSLEALVRGDAGWGVPENDARYATGALFVRDLYARGGVGALRSLNDMSSEPAAILASMRKRLGLPVSDAGALDRWWREAARNGDVR